MVELEGSISNSRDKRFLVWDVPDPFWAMRSTEDPQYLEGEKKGTKSRAIEAKNPNVQLPAPRTVSKGEMRNHRLLRLTDLRNIEVGEQLIVTAVRTSCSRT